MNEQWTTRLQQRTTALYRYMHAMEHGDTDTMSSVLYEAERDRVLERMIMETNEIYQIEDRTVAHADDIEATQILLADMLPASPISPPSRSNPQRGSSSQTTNQQPQTPFLSIPNHSPNITKTSFTDTKSYKKETSAPGRLHIPTQTSIKRIATSRYSWLITVAATLLILIALPVTNVLANQFLALFRVQQLQPVTIDSQESMQALLTTLQSIGDLQPQHQNTSDNHQNLTQAEAEKIVGYHVLLPGHLPTGVSNVQKITVISSNLITYTFNMSKAKAYLAKNGQSSIAIPAQLDGASYTIATAANVNIRYSSCTQNKEHCQQGTPFVINEIASPSIQSNGNASITQLRDFLLSLPNLSASTHELLRHIDEKTGTLPVPIPPESSSEQVTIHGTSGWLLKSKNVSAVIWEAQGIMYRVVLGTNDKTQLLDAVNSFN